MARAIAIGLVGIGTELAPLPFVPIYWPAFLGLALVFALAVGVILTVLGAVLEFSDWSYPGPSVGFPRGGF